MRDLGRPELSRVGESKCLLYEIKLSLLRRDSSPSRVISTPETTRAGSYKQLVESLKDYSEKLARPG